MKLFSLSSTIFQESVWIVCLLKQSKFNLKGLLATSNEKLAHERADSNSVTKNTYHLEEFSENNKCVGRIKPTGIPNSFPTQQPSQVFRYETLVLSCMWNDSVKFNHTERLGIHGTRYSVFVKFRNSLCLIQHGK